MTQPVTGSAPPAARAHPSTWDPAGTTFGARRAVAAACMVAFAAAAAAVSGGLGPAVAALVVVDIAVMSLPWRVPRAGRSMPSIWLENLAYLVMPMGALLAAIATRPGWLGNAGSWWWYAVAVVAGAALVAGSGVDLRALASGELAFLMGPRPKQHAAAHVLSALVGPPGEEVAFRAPLLYTSGVAAVAAPPLGVLGFVARHHLAPQARDRIDRRVLVTQVAAALIFLALTALSRSVYPALVAHLLNNIPQAVLEAQRGWGGD